MRFAIGGLALVVATSNDPEQVAGNARCAVEAIRALRQQESTLRIVLLPQGILAGGATDLSASARGMALDILAECAQETDVYIAAADWFDGQLTGFVIAPAGGLALEQPCLSTPATGTGAVAVLETPCGVLACMPGDDTWFPEYVRLAVFAGAEIILSPCAERSDQQSAARRLARSARAWENHVVVAAASARQGLVEIWDHTGELLVETAADAASACIDLQALRQRRREPWANFPATLRTALYAGFYERAVVPKSAVLEGPSYDVLLMQTHQVFATELESRDVTLQQNLRHGLQLARPFCMRPATRLVVFPEFFLQGSAMGRSLDWWEQMGIRIPGPETAQLAEFARSCNVFLSGAVLEYDPEWPQRYFNTALIFAPSGEIILRYRKLQCADLNGLLNVTTPGNIYSQYVSRYGERALVPVVDTEIGRLGALVCFDSNWPELWRALALQGAEIICNPTSEIHSERNGPWTRAKHAHAAENLVYVASANAGSEQLTPQTPITQMNRGHSELIDFHGRTASCAAGSGVVPLLGRIDLGTLRRARANHSENVLTRFQPSRVAAAYRRFSGFPLDCFGDRPMREAAEGPALVRAHIERLLAAKILR